MHAWLISITKGLHRWLAALFSAQMWNRSRQPTQKPARILLSIAGAPFAVVLSVKYGLGARLR
ncbi:hypothetical protein KY49_1452 [Burkholderia sp. MSHR3999]|uniref:hypothetical protein n=1 Tax=Burkholderia TaxID=32008 RepID=UPI0005B744B6|nr:MULTISPECIES: hypothetical protein [Burkholderia]KIP13890.1 hypothetical protein KY49_1452 [Burkholderia sp. MSHR3999]